MDFAEQPKLFIIEYFNEKKNQIDWNCENAILNIKDDLEIKNLHEMRQKMIDKIESVRKEVLERYEAFESKFPTEISRENTKKIKDEIFLDQYCLVLNVYQLFPLFEYKIGLLLFSEFQVPSLHLLR